MEGKRSKEQGAATTATTATATKSAVPIVKKIIVMSSDAPHSRKSRLSVPTGADPLSGGRASASFTAAANATTSSSALPLWQYLTRLSDVRQMDVQSALDQMKTLLSARPQVVYKTAYYRKQTKNHWARDDPAFVALQGLFLLIAAVAYSVAFRITLSGAVSFILYTVLWVRAYPSAGSSCCCALLGFP
jgi:hypothetical protein